MALWHWSRIAVLVVDINNDIEEACRHDYNWKVGHRSFLNAVSFTLVYVCETFSFSFFLGAEEFKYSLTSNGNGGKALGTKSQ